MNENITTTNHEDLLKIIEAAEESSDISILEQKTQYITSDTGNLQFQVIKADKGHLIEITGTGIYLSGYSNGLFVLSGNLIITMNDLPTSSAGLGQNVLYNDGGFLKINGYNLE